MKLNNYEIEHNRVVRKLAPECTLLLKSDGAFPLSVPCKIALFGNGARNTLRGGTGSGEVYSRYNISIEKGLKKSGFTITTGKWLDDYQYIKEKAKKRWAAQKRKENPGIKGIVNMMGLPMPEPEYHLPIDYDGDAAIYVLSRVSGEGSDRTEARGGVRLSKTEIRDILALNLKFEKFMLVLNVGGVVDLSEVMEVKNILLLSQLGALSGKIFSDLLIGKAYPSGKLSATWANLKDYSSIGEFGDKDDTRYKEGIYVGYRYFDSVGIKPLFPFGFGLSYTNFKIEPGDFSIDGRNICVNVNVTNTGNFRGKEVCQLYVSVPEADLNQPYQSLAAFEKTKELLPGESCRLTLSFDMADVASYDSKKCAYVLENGTYILRVGSSSRDTVEIGGICIEEPVIIRKVKNVVGDCGFEDWKPNHKKQENTEHLNVIKIDTSVFTTEKVNYKENHDDIVPFARKLSDKDLCSINIGSYGKGLLSIIGNASQKVAGAAGDFTFAFEKQGLPGMVTADGPAGLRISKRYIKDKKGIHPIGNDMLGMIDDFLPGPVKKIVSLMERKPKAGEKIYEQYCTMIPIGTAVAQSFNPMLAAKLGDVVGSEMKRFKVNFWLAPAMNIHRSIFCGRNFEYYSEDPLLSGKMAAAVTRGVQAHPGCAVTIKHYAANNQETNRFNSNSLVSERAMREIYLRGFGICIRESQPKAVMTSYNLLNGIHTAEHRGLIEDILRKEYGFNGIVMTDWMIHGMLGSGKYPAPISWKIAGAGGDVMMPGSKKDYKDLLKGLKDGKISRKQLEINASRMFKTANELVQND